MGTVQVNGVEIIYDLFKNIVSFIMGVQQSKWCWNRCTQFVSKV